MTEIQIPWVEGAKYFKVLCRLGINKPDIVDDDDRYPNLTSQGGTVEIVSSVSKFRYTELDGRSRMVYTVKETYNIQPSTGELEDADGNVGVFLIDTSSPGIDPPNFTYTATVRPAMGEAFPVTIPGSPGSEVVDLVAHASVSPSTGDSTIESRVAMLEQQVSDGGGVDAEAVQDIVGAMVTGAGGTYDDVDGTVTLPSGAVSSVAGRTGDVVLSSADLTDVDTLVTDAELADGLATKANSSHTHSITNVSGLQSALDGKAATGHTHAELHTHANAAALDLVSGTNTGDEPAASETVAGVVELATTAEASAGTDATRAVTPAGVAAAIAGVGGLKVYTSWAEVDAETESVMGLLTTDDWASAGHSTSRDSDGVFFITTHVQTVATGLAAGVWRRQELRMWDGPIFWKVRYNSDADGPFEAWQDVTYWDLPDALRMSLAQAKDVVVMLYAGDFNNPKAPYVVGQHTANWRTLTGFAELPDALVVAHVFHGGTPTGWASGNWTQTVVVALADGTSRTITRVSTNGTSYGAWTLRPVVELATTAEATAGTDTTRAVTPAGLKAVADTKAPALGPDDNYVTDAEKTKLANLSGTNTGDQDLSGYVQTTNVPELIRDTIGSTLVAGSNVTITPDDANDTVTIAASGGGGIQDLYFNDVLPGGWVWHAARKNYTLPAGTLRLFPYRFDRSVTLNSLSVTVGTATTSGSVRMGIWSFGGTLIFDSGNISTATTGNKTVTTTQTLDPGTYLVGMLSDESTSLVNGVWAFFPHGAVSANTYLPMPHTNPFLHSLWENVAFGPLPNTLPAPLKEQGSDTPPTLPIFVRGVPA